MRYGMADGRISIEKYISSPTDVDLRFEIGSAELTATLKKLFSRKSDFIFTKWKYLQKIGDILVKDGKLKPFTLHLERTLKPMAYMVDDGRVFLSLGLLLTRSSLTVLSVYAHELSHIWLSQREDYSELRALQREFKGRFGENEYCGLMSPIEIYADVLTLGIFREIELLADSKSHREKIRKLIENRSDKIGFLVSEIKKLEIYN